MDPAIKKAAIVIALALVVVLALIGVIHVSKSKDAQIAAAVQTPIAETVKQTPEIQEADAQKLPAQEAEASEVSKPNEAPDMTEAAQDEDLYEGALAGLSEEEIAKMALAEEAGAARNETTGTEETID